MVTERIQVWIEGDRSYRNTLKSIAAQADTTQECLLRAAADRFLALDVQLIKQILEQSDCTPPATTPKGR